MWLETYISLKLNKLSNTPSSNVEILLLLKSLQLERQKRKRNRERQSSGPQTIPPLFLTPKISAVRGCSPPQCLEPNTGRGTCATALARQPTAF